MAVLTATHESGLKYEFHDFTDTTTISEVFRGFSAHMKDQPKSLHLSETSFRKLINEFTMIKGWTASIGNPRISVAQAAMRKSKRKEERKQPQRDTKVTKTPMNRSIVCGAVMDALVGRKYT